MNPGHRAEHAYQAAPYGQQAHQQAAPQPQTQQQQYWAAGQQPQAAPMPQPQAQQAPAASGAEELLSSLGGNSMAAKMGMQMGQKWLSGGASVVQSSLGKYISPSTLKYYFAVSNSYVVNKLRLLEWPFGARVFAREVVGGSTGGAPSLYNPMGAPPTGPQLAAGVQAYAGSPTGGKDAPKYKTPREDVYAPDLYIPFMAFVTYVLLAGFLLGSSHSDFSPDMLGAAASSGLVFLLLELAVIKGGFLVLGGAAVSSLDIIAYCAYKFVGVCINHVAGILLGSLVYHISLLFHAACMATFMVKTLKRLLLPGVDVVFDAAGTQRNYYIFFVAALQLPLMWMLGYSHLL